MASLETILSLLRCISRYQVFIIEANPEYTDNSSAKASTVKKSNDFATRIPTENNILF